MGGPTVAIIPTVHTTDMTTTTRGPSTATGCRNITAKIMLIISRAVAKRTRRSDIIRACSPAVNAGMPATESAKSSAPRWLQITEKVFRYASDAKAMARLERAAPDRVIAVTYEDLKDDQALPLGRIARFLGIDDVPLASAFPADSSFGGGGSADFRQFTKADRLLIHTLSWAFAAIPFRVM